MRLILYISLLLTLARCANTSQELKTSYQDSVTINNLKELNYIKSELDQIVTTDSTMQSELDKKRLMIDSLIQKSLDYKENVIQTEYLSIVINKIKKEKNKLIDRNDSLKLINRQLELEVEHQQRSIKEERALNKVVSKQRNDFRQKIESAQELHVTGLQVKAYGYQSSLFSKPKQ